MKFIAFVIGLALFVGGMFLMGYATSPAFDSAIMFFAGIIAICLSLAIPFHLLKRLDS